MVNHEIGELLAVDQDDPLTEPLHVALGLPGEPSGGNEHALGGLGHLQGTDERLNVRATDRLVGPPLGLDIDQVHAKSVLIDHPVQATISAAPKASSGISPRAAVPD